MPTRDELEAFLRWNDGLPVPDWNALSDELAPRNDEVAERRFWSEAAREWLFAMRDSLAGYTVSESEHFTILEPVPSLTRFAEFARAAIGRRLSDVATFPPWKIPVLLFRDRNDYYRYVSIFMPDGEWGTSGGMQIREGYGHIAINGSVRGSAELVIAHELTHVALQRLGHPLWIEEGLAMSMESELVGHRFVEMTREIADKHKSHWSRNGLEGFWFGDGFHSMGEVQELSYQLAYVLMRLLIEEYRPRWFGFVREPWKRFQQFLRAATATDGGAEAARAHLGRELNAIAAMFLGAAATDYSS